MQLGGQSMMASGAAMSFTAGISPGDHHDN
jgi:hypothetical protein